MSFRVPPYRRYSRKKATDLACVDLPTGVGSKIKRYYLGAYGTAVSRDRYAWLIGEWIKLGSRTLPTPTWRAAGATAEAPMLFVGAVTLAAHYIRHLRYTKRLPRGKFKDHYNVLASMKLFREAMHHRNMIHLTAHELDHVLAVMVNKGWALATIRDRMRHIRHAVLRAVKSNLIPATTLQHLQLVDKVNLATPGIKAPRKVRPVADSVINATLPHLNRHIVAIIGLLRRTGARPSEIVSMRRMDIDISGKVWLYRPVSHKTSHKGRTRVIALAAEAQAILEPFLLGRSLDALVFDPREAEQERRSKLHAERKTPLQYGNAPGTNVKADPQIRVGDRYEVAVLRRAIHRACKDHDIVPWNIYQIRHTAATHFRRIAGLEATSLALGHSDATLTAEVYAEADLEKVIELAEKVG